jgi:hypothetical protein
MTTISLSGDKELLIAIPKRVASDMGPTDPKALPAISVRRTGEVVEVTGKLGGRAMTRQGDWPQVHPGFFTVSLQPIEHQ